MDKLLLEELVKLGLSSYNIAQKTGKSKTTIRYWLNKYELATRRVYKCRICKDTNKDHFSSGRFSECKKCRTRYQSGTSKRRKIELVKYKGGKCIKCGYNKCLASLDFHHRNPENKDPNWRRMRNWSLEKVKSEVDKCDLLCKNCHCEIHYGEFSECNSAEE
jgi:hypothetical protein